MSKRKRRRNFVVLLPERCIPRCNLVGIHLSFRNWERETKFASMQQYSKSLSLKQCRGNGFINMKVTCWPTIIPMQSSPGHDAV